VIAIAARSGSQPPVTQGSVRRRYEEPLGSLLLLSNEVYPGFSGGPVIDEAGKLVGLVIGRLEQAPADWADAPAEGGASSFALAGDDLRTILSHLEEYGRVRRGYLGVRMVQGEVVDANRPDDPFRIGVRVEEVLPDSPAAQIDLRPGDLIVGWNGETLMSPEDLMRRVEGSPPGTIVPLVWVRNEERREGRLVVGAKPDDARLATPRERAPAIPPDTARVPG
jgi:serine protease Do